MSEIQRYTISWGWEVLVKNEHGDLVKYEDVRKLEEENARLREGLQVRCERINLCGTNRCAYSDICKPTERKD